MELVRAGRVEVSIIVLIQTLVLKKNAADANTKRRKCSVRPFNFTGT